MIPLVAELKVEHKRILALMDIPEKTDLKSPEYCDSIRNLRDILPSHIQKEDLLMYPVLIKTLKRDPDIKPLTQTLETELKVVMKVMTDFYVKCYKEIDCNSCFERFENLSGAIKNRITQEENIMFAEYEKKIKRFM